MLDSEPIALPLSLESLDEDLRSTISRLSDTQTPVIIRTNADGTLTLVCVHRALGQQQQQQQQRQQRQQH